MKFAHLEKDTNKLLGWYSDDIHGKWIDPVYEQNVIQEEEKDEHGNIIKEKIIENVFVKDGYYDISKIPTPNIKVEEEVWQNAININANCYENGNFIVKEFRTEEEIFKDSIPKSITMRQARLHLLDLGLLDEIEILISQDKRYQIEWEYASEVLRNSPLISIIQTSLNLSNKEIDNMFINASKI